MTDALMQLPYDWTLAREAPEIEKIEVLGVAGEFIIMPDACHDWGGNYTAGWKITLGKHEYGDFIGHLDTREQARQAKDVLLHQCRLTIEAIRKRETDGTDKKGAE